MVGVLLINPKFATNVGGVLRACAAFGATHLWWTGDRVLTPDNAKVVKRYARLPREVRMQTYRDTVYFDHLSAADEADIWRGRTVLAERTVVPVAVEFRDSYEQLPYFEHPRTRSMSSAQRMAQSRSATTIAGSPSPLSTAST